MVFRRDGQQANDRTEWWTYRRNVGRPRDTPNPRPEPQWSAVCRALNKQPSSGSKPRAHGFVDAGVDETGRDEDRLVRWRAARLILSSPSRREGLFEVYRLLELEKESRDDEEDDPEEILAAALKLKPDLLHPTLPPSAAPRVVPYQSSPAPLLSRPQYEPHNGAVAETVRLRVRDGYPGANFHRVECRAIKGQLGTPDARETWRLILRAEAEEWGAKPCTTCLP